MANTPRYIRTKKKRKIRKSILFILLPFLIALIVVGSYVTHLYISAKSVMSDSYEDHGREKSDLRKEKVDPDIDNVSILIMGVDASDTRGNKGAGLTDSLILATLNKDDKSVKMVSIPRDSYVNIPGEDISTKITEAHSYGGDTKTTETVEKLLNVPVDYYVKVNFDAFIDVVDAVDGVKVDVPYDMDEQDSKDRANAIHLDKGKQTLKGEEALAFARTRKQDSDIERGKRQQEVMKAVLDKAKSMGSVLKYDDIIKAIGKNMKTDMTFDNMKSFISYGTSKDLSIDSLSLKGYDYQPANKYLYRLDRDSLQETQKKLRKQLDLSKPKSDSLDDILPYTEDGQQPSYDNPDQNNQQQPNDSGQGQNDQQQSQNNEQDQTNQQQDDQTDQDGQYNQ